MYEGLAKRNAVIAVRVSSEKQFHEGDSPEAQREQLKRLAASLNANVKKTFTFAESGAKADQPMQAAIDYCRDPKNNIQFFLIKSIDRFTRGGADFYGPLKKQLDQIGVNLVDSYGIISQQRVNTLDHLDISYSWSEYSPSQKTEYLEAERAKDELRDILTRVVGAEIRYTRIGYWMRQAPYGFIGEKVETRNGKRTILKEHPVEGPLLKRIFELREAGILHDREIIADLNQRGFKTRAHYIRDKYDRTKILGKRGGNPLDKDAMDLLLRNPIYAGVNNEKWTNGKPVRTVFDGLVSIETFNKANRGKVFIVDDGDDITIQTEMAPPHQVNKGIRNPEFPYRKFVGCSKCGSPMYGSTSRGYNGTRYPAYHCNKGHYFRIPKKELEDTIIEFVKRISLPQEQIDFITKLVMTEWERRQKAVDGELERYDVQIKELEAEAIVTVKKLKYLESETAIKYMEGDLTNIEQKIKQLKAERDKKATQEPINMGQVMSRVKYFLENLDKVLVKQIDPVKRAQFFGVFFNRIPTYEELKTRTENKALITGIAELLKLGDPDNPGLVAPPRLELGTQGSSGLCSTN
jgi:site-specific DNA recombinase